MKYLISQITFLRKNKKILLFTGLLLLVVTLIVSLAKISNNIALSKKHSKNEPEVTLTSKEELIADIQFNNIVGGDTALDSIVDIINNTQKTLEIAMFSFDSQKIKQAIYDASNRGVSVTLILDSSRGEKHNAIFADMPKAIERIDSGEYNSKDSLKTRYMHHKMLIADRGLPQQKMVNGSLNYTSKAEKYEQSFYWITTDKNLINIYGQEIDFLKNGVNTRSKLKNLAYNPWAAHIQYPDSYVDIWFSPGVNNNSIKYKTLDLINSAKSSIDILMWQITDQSVVAALVNKANEGVKVRVITDDLASSGENSVIAKMQTSSTNEVSKNLELILDTKLNDKIDASEFWPGFNVFTHHHTMIVDSETVVFGTNNWTTWGFYYNDEDTIVTNNKYFVTEFQKTFDYFYKILK